MNGDGGTAMDGMGANDFLGRGWSFPPNFDLGSGSVEMTEGVEDIRGSLRILLTTTAGERVMLPKYGCNLEELLFESLDTTTRSLVKDRIRTAILYFEPRIDVESIGIEPSVDGEGELLVSIAYVVRSTNSRQNVVFPFHRTEGTEIAQQGVALLPGARP